MNLINYNLEYKSADKCLGKIGKSRFVGSRTIKDSINDLLELIVLQQQDITNHASLFAEIIYGKYLENRTIFLCGNGGSAADAQHFTAELVCKFNRERSPIAAVDLTSNPSTISAIGNDMGFDKIFSRQLNGLINKKDLLIVFSTSGNSINIVNAVEAAVLYEADVMAFLGNPDGILAKKQNINKFIVKNNNTARIQEIHGLVMHLICEIIDNKFI